jgi:hypothetical protein
MFVRPLAALAATLLLLVAPLSDASAQIRASELGTVAQTVDGTTITVVASRPVVRGRDPIFGGVVHWGEVWTPGANWAATVEVSKDVTVNGHALAKGKYSLWMVVQPEQWEIVFHPKPRLFHLAHPGPSDDQLRFMVKPTEASHTEVMTFSFPVVEPSGTVLSLRWAATEVSLRFDVEPSQVLTVAKDIVEPYIGAYELAFVGENMPPPGRFETYYEGDMLKVRWGFAERMADEMILIRVTDEWYNAGFLKDGALYDVWRAVLEFNVDSGRATGFEFRDDDDTVFARGTRLE